MNAGALAGAPEALLERAVRLTLEWASGPTAGDAGAPDAPDAAPGPPDAAPGVQDAAPGPPGVGRAAEISLTLLGDEEIAALNRQYLGREGSTDVLAFSLGEPDAPLGDVYVGFEQAGRQAAEHRVPLDEELARLAIHGTLHVLGHDHPDGPDRVDSPMFRLQERLLGELLGRPGTGR